MTSSIFSLWRARAALLEAIQIAPDKTQIVNQGHFCLWPILLQKAVVNWLEP